jgi:hypothetical protein
MNNLKLTVLQKLLIKHLVSLLHPEVVRRAEKHEFTTEWDVQEAIATTMTQCVLQLQQ